MAALVLPVAPICRSQAHVTHLKLPTFVYTSKSSSLPPTHSSGRLKLPQKARSVRAKEAAGLWRGELVRGCFLSTLFQASSSQAEAAAPSKTSQDTVPLLYYFPLAFNPQKARLALEEKGLKYDIKIVNALTGANLTADYLKINPSATVPTLQTGPGQYIRDSNDILRYIDTQGEPLGGSLVDRALVEKWYKFVGEEWDANLYAFTAVPGPAKIASEFKVNVAKAQKQRYPELADEYQKRVDMFSRYTRESGDEGVKKSLEATLASALSDAETQLKSTRFVAGDAFSMADVILVTILARMDNVGRQAAYMARPAIVKYFEEAKKRNSYKVAIGDYAGPGALPYILPTVGELVARNLFKQYAY